MQWSVTQNDDGLIVTWPLWYTVFYNLYHEPWSRKGIICFDSKVTNIVFFCNQFKNFVCLNCRNCPPPGNWNHPPNLVNHKITPTTHKIAHVEDLWIRATNSFALCPYVQYVCSYCWFSNYTEWWCTARILFVSYISVFTQVRNRIGLLPESLHDLTTKDIEPKVQVKLLKFPE